MNRARSLAGLGTLVVFASGGSVLACFNDGTTGGCKCGARMSLSNMAPAAPSVKLTRGLTLDGGLDTTQLVHVFNFDFSINPSGMPIMDATINLGDTIHWQWDSGFHSVTSVAGSVEAYNSGDLFGGTFDHTFTHTGVFTYYCDLHGFDNGDGTAGGMVGTITVVGTAASTWNVDADADWDAPASWSGGVPDAVDAQAVLGNVITQPRTVTLNTSRTVGKLTLDNSNRYTLAGTGTLNVDVASGVGTIDARSGSHTIATLWKDDLVRLLTESGK